MSETENTEQNIPIRRIFISYSWSSDDYANRVRELCEELANHALDVELDQWSLEKGDDKYHYMERMVKDPSVEKILILLDKDYKRKADERVEGVGTETTILSPQVYADVVKNIGKQKFIPVVMERNPDTGEPYIPTFLDGRIYVDLTNVDHYSERFEELVRAIHDKPRFRKPKPGKPPSYLLSREESSVGTSSSARRAVEFITNERPQSLNAVKDYFSSVSENIRVFDFPASTGSVKDEEVLDKVHKMTALRDEIIDVFFTISRYRTDVAVYEELKRFFESLIPYFDYRNADDSSHDWAADHYKFFGHELFLYVVASLIRFGHFEHLNELTEQGYYVAGGPYSRHLSGLLPFSRFNNYSNALDYFNRRQPQKFLSFEAHLINQRAMRSDIRKEDLHQADLLLYLIHKLLLYLIHKIDEDRGLDSPYLNWYPIMLTFAEYRDRPYEVFSRSESLRYFERFKVCLRNISKEDLTTLIEKLKSGDDRPGRRRTNLGILTGVENLASRP